MRRVEFETRQIDYGAWVRMPLSYSEWWKLPDVEWIQVTLPWSVGWVRMGDDHGFTMGGWDPLVVNWQWSLQTGTSWKLWTDDLVFISGDDDKSYPRVVACLTGLVGRAVTCVEALSSTGEGYVFSFSDGSRLETGLSSSGGLERIHVWGCTLLGE